MKTEIGNLNLEIESGQNPTSDFLSVRHGRTVIQNGGMRDQLLRLPRMQSFCPVQIVFFRRFGLGE